MSDDRIVLRSYRLAFELERRIHRVDRFRIPLPYGLPLDALGLGLVAAVAVVAASTLPVLGPALELLPWPLRLLLIPGLAAQLLARRGGDGRPAYEALGARLHRRLAPRRLAGWEQIDHRGRWAPEPLSVVPDERCPDLRPGVVIGAARVLLRRPARGLARRARVELEPLDGPPLWTARELELGACQRLVIR